MALRHQYEEGSPEHGSDGYSGPAHFEALPLALDHAVDNPIHPARVFFLLGGFLAGLMTCSMGTKMVSTSAPNLFAVGVGSLCGQQAQGGLGPESNWILA